MILDVEYPRFFNDIFDDSEYDFLFKDFVVIDIGCNVGAFSFWIKDLAKIVHAIDISKENIDKMNLLMMDNKIFNVETYVAGISGKTGESSIVMKDVDASRGNWKLGGNGKRKVDTYTLGDFMDKYKIDYADIVKIDVEGTEVEIAKDFPSDRVTTVFGEYHSGVDAKQLGERFEEMGYRFYLRPTNHFIARK